jgi:hypothetical protein
MVWDSMSIRQARQRFSFSEIGKLPAVLQSRSVNVRFLTVMQIFFNVEARFHGLSPPDVVPPNKQYGQAGKLEE